MGDPEELAELRLPFGEASVAQQCCVLVDKTKNDRVTWGGSVRTSWPDEGQSRAGSGAPHPSRPRGSPTSEAVDDRHALLVLSEEEQAQWELAHEQ